MSWKEEWKALTAIVVGFVAIYYLPLEWLQQLHLPQSLREALHLARWYAQEHVLLCLAPAFFIAGAVGVFVSQAAVIKYPGPQANKPLAYGGASVPARYFEPVTQNNPGRKKDEKDSDSRLRLRQVPEISG